MFLDMVMNLYVKPKDVVWRYIYVQVRLVSYVAILFLILVLFSHTKLQSEFTLEVANVFFTN